ncbi:uncharacterized protein LOC134819509 isoform X2 [Bolinopsis microptera]|uniref:uncharacterized protein LOC134819509 isoform X2 n=1 Tax=Bolinopsis microptera TaxID=2820187 RepID=UPI0030798BF8
MAGVYFFIGLGCAMITIGISGYPPIQPCPGEGPRYGDFKCNHDRTHRVCAQLVDNSEGQCKELAWNDDQQSFWQITGQQKWNWKTNICNPPNPGDSWCICMWATESLIAKVGCDNVHINCEATDIPYLLRSVSDGGWDLSTSRECIKKKCPEPKNRPEPHLNPNPNKSSGLSGIHTHESL